MFVVVPVEKALPVMQERIVSLRSCNDHISADFIQHMIDIITKRQFPVVLWDDAHYGVYLQE
jgi:hypothetical protein